MNKLAIIIFFILGFIFCKTSHSQEWTTEQKQLAGIATALHIIDWGQTRYIAKHPDQFKELNPLLPDHPSLSQVNKYFIISSLIIGSAAHLLPEYRSTLLKMYIGVQIINTTRNFTLGLRLTF